MNLRLSIASHRSHGDIWHTVLQTIAGVSVCIVRFPGLQVINMARIKREVRATVMQ